jgi:phenylpropionate dioxygenase-like ring-hydroxylating dioxygenase large terminal subunit
MTDLTESPTATAAAPIHPEMGADEPRYPFGIPYGWFQVAWSGDVGIGDVIPRYYFGRHLALWRDESGTVRLNDAFCPHLGAHFGYGGRVDGAELVCPFHGWQFDADGLNTLIPYGNRINQRARIRSYAVREIDQFVMAWYHPDDAEPLYEVEPPVEIGESDFSEWTNVAFSVKAGCQEMAENSVDGPHFRYVHNTEVVPEIQSYDTDGARSHMRSVQRFPTPRGVVDGRIDVDNQGPGFSITRFSGIVDTLLVGAAIPVDAVRSEVRFSFKTRSLGDAATTSTVGDAFVAEVCKQFEEDRPIWEHKAHVVRPALADTDPPFMKFRKWYAQFYVDGLDTTRGVWSPGAPEGDGQPVYVRPARTASSRYRSES